MVEHRLAKARVASSSLVSRSRYKAKEKSKKEKREHVLPFSFQLLPFYFRTRNAASSEASSVTRSSPDIGGVAKW